ncbi:MAG: hypothetical protein U0235_03120 [Polyangiaceae bacterium]
MAAVGMMWLVCGCSTASEAVAPADAGAVDGDAAACVAPMKPFDPAGRDTTCAEDADCTFSERIMDDEHGPTVCHLSCCAPVAFRATPAVSAELAAAKASCCGGTWGCAKGCAPVRAACVKGECKVVSAVVGADAGAADAGASDAATDAGTDGS